MVIKKEGAEMTCKNCSTDLICRMKDYDGNFPSKLQWQNFDGSAHYSTTDGKNYSCNIPDDDSPEAPPGQTQITSPATTPGNPASGHVTRDEFTILARFDERLQEMNTILLRVDEMVQAIFRYTVDEQLKKK